MLHITPFAVSGVMAGISSLSFGLFVLLKCPDRRLAKTWFLFCCSVASWGFGGMLWGCAAHPRLGLWIGYGFGVVWISALFYHFVCTFLEIDRRCSILIHYSIAALFFFTVPTPLFFTIHRAFGNIYYGLGGNAFPFFFLWWMGLVWYSHYELIHAYKIASVEKQNRIKYFFLATAIGFLGGSLAYLPNFGIYIYPWGNFTVCLYPVIMSYAIVKHRLMNIDIFIRKTLIYSVLTLTITTIYVGVVTAFAELFGSAMGHQTWLTSVTAACFITIIFHPLRTKVQAFVDAHFSDRKIDPEVMKELTSSFVHEIKTPLANIAAPAELALMDLRDVEGGVSLQERLPEIQKRLKFILRQAIDASHKMDALREISNNQSSKESLAISRVIQSSLVSTADLLNDCDIVVDLDFKNLSPVCANPKQLEIVFVNLIQNSAEAMRNSALRRLSLLGREENGSVVISVKDTGRGIPEDIQPRIFEPYFSTKGTRGMGMGLYLAKNIIANHGGSIDVKSQPGQGAEFMIRLPKANGAA